MKTARQVEADILNITHNFDIKPMVKKMKLEVMNQCLLYLKTNPKEEFVINMKRELRLLNINNGYISWLENTHGIYDSDKRPKKFLSKLKSEYNRLLDKKKINFQLRALSYILE